MKSLKIFLSYAGEQSAIAERVRHALANAGHTVFWDKESLIAGRDYNEAIRRELRGSDLFIFLVSRQSIEPGGYARTELAFAEEVWPAADGHVLPVIVDSVSDSALPSYLGSVTVLRPQGDPGAEIVAAVARLAGGMSDEETAAGQRRRLRELARRQERILIERRWEEARQRYEGGEGSGRSKPSVLRGLLFFVFALVLAGLVLAGASQAPRQVAAFGPFLFAFAGFVLLIGLLGGVTQVVASRRYRRAKSDYEERLRALEESEEE